MQRWLPLQETHATPLPPQVVPVRPVWHFPAASQQPAQVDGPHGFGALTI